jgi:hypothetical protein
MERAQSGRRGTEANPDHDCSPCVSFFPQSGAAINKPHKTDSPSNRIKEGGKNALRSRFLLKLQKPLRNSRLGWIGLIKGLVHRREQRVKK